MQSRWYRVLPIGQMSCRVHLGTRYSHGNGSWSRAWGRHQKDSTRSCGAALRDSSPEQPCPSTTLTRPPLMTPVSITVSRLAIDLLVLAFGYNHV